MDYKHCCVIDAEGFFVVFVLALYQRVYGPPPVEDGAPNWSKVETRFEWVPDHYRLTEGERLIDSYSPITRHHAGAAGFIRPQWDDAAGGWVEASTAEEIAAWEAEHPVPPPGPPSVEERVKLVEAQIGATNDRQDFVEDCIAEMAVQVYDV